MDLLDSRQLRAFQELSRQQSFTRAAQALHLTQSAVSHSIKALESALDTPLCERVGKSVRLTPAGERLLPHVNSILARMEQAQDDLIRLRAPGHGRLRIGATVTISQFVLPAVLRELRESFPAYEITITTEDTRQLLGLLDTGEIDIAIGLQTGDAHRYQFRSLFVDEIAMAMAPLHPLNHGRPLSADDLTDQSFIFYSRDSETFRLLERSLTKMAGRPQTNLQVGSMAAIKELAKIGMGIGLMAPWIALDEIDSGELAIHTLPWEHTGRHWGLYGDSKREPSMVEDIFFGLCRNVMENLQTRATASCRATRDAPPAATASA